MPNKGFWFGYRLFKIGTTKSNFWRAYHAYKLMDMANREAQRKRKRRATSASSEFLTEEELRELMNTNPTLGCLLGGAQLLYALAMICVYGALLLLCLFVLGALFVGCISSLAK